MTSFFNALGNPFSTQVGQKIEEATDSNLASENWALILTVCDLINGTEDGPKDAIRAIKKRLQQSVGKNYKTVLHTLTLLEACVKNCDRRFHILVCSKDFIQELIKLIEPKNDPPVNVQEKVLSLIQSWADAFCHQPEMSAVVKMYNELKSKGIEFPMTDLDTMAPIHTPRKTTFDMNSPNRTNVSTGHSVVDASLSQVNAVPLSTTVGESALRLNPEQLAKLRSELDIVQENMTILNEMLTELVPGQEHPSDLELLSQLYHTCKAMQERLVELISQLANDEVTADLLRINDLLNNLFLRYSRYEKNRMAKLSQGDAGETHSLVDLGPDDDVKTETLVDDFKKLSTEKPESETSQSSFSKPDSEFDMFAQSRTVTYENSKKGSSTYEDNLKPDMLSGGLAAATRSRSQPNSTTMHRESDFDEMAAWLGQQGAVTESDSLTSTEFDRFLAERAAAAENLPDQTSADHNDTSSTSRSTPSHRNKYSNKDMYAL